MIESGLLIFVRDIPVSDPSLRVVDGLELSSNVVFPDVPGKGSPLSPRLLSLSRSLSPSASSKSTSLFCSLSLTEPLLQALGPYPLFSST